tara:strand:- start:3030 stop:3908 length:879 start_codon:yes stop_codon:yes gene_type:complete
MILHKFIYLLFEGFKIIFRSIIPSFVCSFTISVSLIILSISFFLYINLYNYTSDFKNEYKIEVFFNNKISQSEGLETFNKILLIDGIEEGVFVDKESAAEIFKEEFNEDIQEIIGENPLPMGAIFGVSTDNRNYALMMDLVKEIKYIKTVDDAIFPEQSIVKFDRVIRNLLSFAFVIGFFIIIVAYFFVSNTILLVIYSKKNEIKTMQLLGASDIFIKFPYILSGSILGIIGSLISIIVLFLLYKISIYVILPYYNINIVNFEFILLFNIIFGCLLGLFSSSRALSNFVRNN